MLLGGGGFFLHYFSLLKSAKHLQNGFNEGSRCICHWMAIFITQEHIMLNRVFLCTIKNLSWPWCLVITLLSLDTSMEFLLPNKFYFSWLAWSSWQGQGQTSAHKLQCQVFSGHHETGPSLTRLVDYNAHLLTASRASFCLLDEEEKRRLYLHILLINVYFRSSEWWLNTVRLHKMWTS